MPCAAAHSCVHSTSGEEAGEAETETAGDHNAGNSTRNDAAEARNTGEWNDAEDGAVRENLFRPLESMGPSRCAS